MKISKKITLGLFIVLSGIWCMTLCSAPTLGKKKSGTENTLPAETGKGFRSRRIEVVAKSEDPPTLIGFILDSDYVVIGSVGDLRAVGKRDKKPADSKDLNMHDWMIGTIYPLAVEELLFSKSSFLDGSAPVPVHTFEIFTITGNVDSALFKGDRYMLFLKGISNQEDIFKTLELDPEKHYYRIISGAHPLREYTGGFIDGFSTIGELDMIKDAKITGRIQTICEALSTRDTSIRRQRLEELSKSKDEVLRDNADYAIRYLYGSQKE